LRYGGFTDLMINKLDALTYSDDWQGGELLICVGYRDSQGNLVKHVPRNAAVHATLRPVYLQLPGWEEDISTVRHFNDLPANARRYVAAMVKTTLEVAYEGQLNEQRELPNLRYIGVGPDPSQIIKDVPEVRDLIRLV